MDSEFFRSWKVRFVLVVINEDANMEINSEQNFRFLETTFGDVSPYWWVDSYHFQLSFDHFLFLVLSKKAHLFA